MTKPDLPGPAWSRDDHARKATIRARMAATGESYSVAARNVDTTGQAPARPATGVGTPPVGRIGRDYWYGNLHSDRYEVNLPYNELHAPTRELEELALDPVAVADQLASGK